MGSVDVARKLQTEVDRIGTRARRVSDAEEIADAALNVYRQCSGWKPALALSWTYRDQPTESVCLKAFQGEVREALRELMLKIAKRELGRMRRACRAPAKKKATP